MLLWDSENWGYNELQEWQDATPPILVECKGDWDQG